MLILAIDTTGPLASCALSDGLHIEQIINDTEYSHLEEIAPMVKRLLEEQKVEPAELDAIAVSRGTVISTKWRHVPVVRSAQDVFFKSDEDEFRLRNLIE